MQQEIKRRIQGLSSLIGNTPLLAIFFRYRGTDRVIYAKLESLNMTGSIKDRMAFHILKKAIERNELKPGQRIIEATSGNTGISFSAIGRALGYPVTVYMPNWLSAERINLIKSLGCEIVLVSKEEGGFLGSIEKAEKQAREENGFLPRQFSNEDNVEAHYLTTAPELWWQLRYRNLQPDAFVAGVGTGGTVMGVGKFLKEQNEAIQVCPVEPSNSPTLTTGYKTGKHRVQGISDEFIPAIVDLSKTDKVISVDDGDSIIMAQKLAHLGIAVGISSGANFLAALKVQEEIGHEKVVVTVFADSNKKYLSTDYIKEEPVNDDFLSTEVELNYFSSFKRVCFTCCDPVTCVEAVYNNEKDIKLPHCARRG
ncbi:MAG: PLP-dependent cysteine synthase family protein [Bacteroidales bacterium]|nr:PLP-dependent cysteine synthase family protein [Bacteroidales bacterium]